MPSDVCMPRIRTSIQKIDLFLSSALYRRSGAMKFSEVGYETYQKKKINFFFLKNVFFDEKIRLDFLDFHILMKILYNL